MWRTVLRLEWRILRRDRAALAVLAVFAGFLIVAAVAGGRHARTLADGLTRSAQEETDRVAGHAVKLGVPSDAPLLAKDPRDAAWMGQEGVARMAVLPASPLAPIAVGQRDLHPQAVRVSTGMHLTAERETETAMSGPTRQMTGAFDPSFLFVVLFPLVVIGLSYELLSGERERGTLAMLLSQPVSQTALVLGKAGARAIVLCGVTLLFAVLGLVVAGAELGAPGAMTQMALYAAILVAWALFWFAAAVAVNAWGGTSPRNALLLVGMWLVLVVIVPGLVSVGVDAIYPPPSRIELMHEAREAAQEAKKQLDGMEGRHDVNKQAKGFAKRIVEVQEELAQRSQPVVHELTEQLNKRQALVDTLRFVSPAIVVQLALEDVAGAGATRHRRFEAQVDEFHATYRTYFYDRIKAETPFTGAHLAGVPKMTFVEEAPGSLAARVLGGVLALLLATALLIGLAWPGLRKVGRLTR